MKLKIFKVVVFIAIIGITDKIVGIICKKLYSKSNDLAIAKLRYTFEKTSENILIFGSSRAENHFIPGIISRHTGLKIYNCGIGGTDLLFSQIQLNETLKRYKPECIIVEVSPSSFFVPAENSKMLLPYYDRDKLIYNTLTGNKQFEKIKFASSIYPYNSTIASLLKGIFIHKTDTSGGFIPADGTIDTAGLYENLHKTFLSAELPVEKFTYLERLMNICNARAIKIIIVYSPMFRVNSKLEEMGNQIKTFCANRKNVYFLDYSKSEFTYGKTDLFKDNTHLSYPGAKIFSEIFALKFKEIMNYEHIK